MVKYSQRQGLLMDVIISNPGGVSTRRKAPIGGKTCHGFQRGDTWKTGPPTGAQFSQIVAEARANCATPCASGVGEHIGLLQLVVCGDQSTGKRSVSTCHRVLSMMADSINVTAGGQGHGGSHACSNAD